MDEPWDTKIVTKVDQCGKALTRWSKQDFGNVKREIGRKRKELAKAEERAIRGGRLKTYENFARGDKLAA